MAQPLVFLIFLFTKLFSYFSITLIHLGLLYSSFFCSCNKLGKLVFEFFQAIEVSKRQMKLREVSGNSDMVSRLEAAESKLLELKSNMGVLGKEAVAAMTAVEAQQQRLTLQRLIALVHYLSCWVIWTT